MKQYIQAVPGWESEVAGVQLGVLLATLTIVALGLIARQLVIEFLPKLVKKWSGKKEGIDKFQLTSRLPLGAAAAGYVWWKLFGELATTAVDNPEILVNGEVIFWLTAFGQASFLIGGLFGAMRLVEIIELVARWIDDDGELDASQSTLLEALQSVTRMAIFIVGVVWIAEAFGFDITTIIAGLGIGGLAFAFAAKDTISNVFGALTLLLDRPFKIGDWIRVGSSEGEVISIGMRTTLIRTSVDTVITLPNGKLVNKDIENFGKRRWRRYRPIISLDLSSDPDTVEKFCRGVETLIEEHPSSMKEDSSYAKLSNIAKDAIEVSCNLYWDVEGGHDEREARESLLLDIARLAKSHELRFFDPRIRGSME